MKAEKLPSGSYRVRITIDGKTYSFTAETEDEAIYKAMAFKTGRESLKKPKEKTVKQCVLEYIESKENLLSISTIRGYNIIYNNALTQIQNIKLRDLTEKVLQQWVNANAATYSAKSLKNQFGLVSSALKQEKIYLDYNKILLPKVESKEPVIPDEKQIGQILRIVDGTSVEIPVTIAVTLGLRQSEIAGLKWSDYDGELLNIHSAKVPDKNNKLVYKNSTKSKASKRKLEVEGILKERLDRAERKSEYISMLLPESVIQTFHSLCDKNGLPRFTMHALRHAYASEMLAMGVPDKYAMQRMGHSTPNMLKKVYQHLYEDKQKEISKAMSDKYTNLANDKDKSKDKPNEDLQNNQ